MTAPLHASAEVPRLFALLEKQRALYQSLSELSRQQAGTIAEGRADALLAILAARQKLIDQIGMLNADLDPFRQRWDAILAALPAGERARAGDLVKQVQQLLGQIVEQDERDRNALTVARNRVQTELQKMNNVGGAINAYRSSAGTPPAAPVAPRSVAVKSNNPVAPPARPTAYPAAPPPGQRLTPRQA